HLAGNNEESGWSYASGQACPDHRKTTPSSHDNGSRRLGFAGITGPNLPVLAHLVHREIPDRSRCWSYRRFCLLWYSDIAKSGGRKNAKRGDNGEAGQEIESLILANNVKSGGLSVSSPYPPCQCNNSNNKDKVTHEHDHD